MYKESMKKDFLKVVYIMRGYLFPWPVLRQVPPLFLKIGNDVKMEWKKDFLEIVYIVRGYLFPWPVLRQVPPFFFGYGAEKAI
jgi:cytochrome c oxidase assembly factor CtaG